MGALLKVLPLGRKEGLAGNCIAARMIDQLINGLAYRHAHTPGLHSIPIDERYCPRFISGPYSCRVRPSAEFGGCQVGRGQAALPSSVVLRLMGVVIQSAKELTRQCSAVATTT